MTREEYLQRATEFAARGAALPQTRLNEDAIREIREAQWKREDLRAHIKENLSNEALAKKFDVHVRTVERVLNYGSWRQA